MMLEFQEGDSIDDFLLVLHEDLMLKDITVLDQVFEPDRLNIHSLSQLLQEK